MSRPLLDDAFGHHVWATARLIDACLALDPEQLGTTVPGTYGSIIETMRHLVAEETDPNADVVRHRDDGTDSHAPLGIRLAQALHHGTDHRSQVCTALTSLGVEPPAIDVWDFAEKDGRISVTPAAS